MGVVCNCEGENFVSFVFSLFIYFLFVYYTRRRVEVGHVNSFQLILFSFLINFIVNYFKRVIAKPTNL